MNSDEELPGDHFWDLEEAEREYYAIGQALADAQERQEEKLAEPQKRLLTILDVYNRFSKTPGVAVVVGRSIPYPNWEREDKELNHALNPYWLPEGGRIDAEEPMAPWQESLVVQNVEHETCQGEVVFNQFVGGTT